MGIPRAQVVLHPAHMGDLPPGAASDQAYAAAGVLHSGVYVRADCGRFVSQRLIYHPHSAGCDLYLDVYAVVRLWPVGHDMEERALLCLCYDDCRPHRLHRVEK